MLNKKLLFAILCSLSVLQGVRGQQTKHDEHKAMSGIISVSGFDLKQQGLQSDSLRIKQLFSALFGASDSLRIHGSYGKAMEYDFFALNLAETNEYPEEIAKSYNNIAISYYRMKSYEKAEKYFLMSANMKIYLKDTVRLADTYYNLGMLYDDMSRNDEALVMHNKALALFQDLNIIDGMADVYNGLAGHYYMQGNIDSVEFYATKALDMFILLDIKDAMAFMYMNIAVLKNLRGNFKEALANLQKGIEIANETKNLNQLRQGYKSLSETYSYLGDYENAYNNYVIYEQYKDSVFNKEQTQIIEELQTKYETDKALKELNEKKAELLLMEVNVQKSKNIRNVFMFALIVIVIVTAALSLRYLENRKTTRLLDRKNKELGELNATKDKFFSIISHDLKSPVTSVARLTAGLEKALDHLEKEDIRKYLSELSQTTDNLNDFLKKLLDWALSQKSGLKPSFAEYDTMELLNETLVNAKQQANLKGVELQCDCNISQSLYADKSMFQTILRNLVSNAIKFADDNSVVYLKAIEEPKHLKFSVINSGPGIHEDDVGKLFKIDGQAALIGNHHAKGSGLGLILCYEFVKIHGGNIFIESHSPENTCFSFTIPDKTGA